MQPFLPPIQLMLICPIHMVLLCYQSTQSQSLHPAVIQGPLSEHAYMQALCAQYKILSFYLRHICPRKVLGIKTSTKMPGTFWKTVAVAVVSNPNNIYIMGVVAGADIFMF